ncbi:MAG: MBL fold metallo-hydrolase [Candidatus Bathyarchaeia archaeon]
MKEAEITSEGVVKLGRYIACDAHYPDRPIRVVTHAHFDHVWKLKNSVEENEMILATPATIRLIQALKGERFLKDKARPLGYGDRLEYGEEQVSLVYANHILGAAQVVLETKGSRIVYTGDFKLPGTPFVECDVLIIEATYGNPKNVRDFDEEVETHLLNIVERGLNDGPVYVFGYHGKLQEAMEIVEKAGVEAPVIVPDQVMRICEAYKEFGVDLGRLICSHSEEGKEITGSGIPFLGFYHTGARKYVGTDKLRVFLTGWEFMAPFRRIGDRDYVVALSDHADFNGLLTYVENSGPEFIITDNYRIGDAVTLAKEIEKRLGIHAVPMPYHKSKSGKVPSG